MSQFEQCANIKFMCNLGKSALKTLSALQQVYGDTALKKSAVYDSFSRFRNGQETLEDDQRSGRYSTSRTEEMIGKVRQLIRCDRKITIAELVLLLAISDFQLSHQTAARQVEQISDNVESQIHQDLKSCEYFSLQLDESTDISDFAQLQVFVIMVFGDFTVKEEFVKQLPLHERTRGEEILTVFLIFISKLDVITTDGGPSSTGRSSQHLEDFLIKSGNRISQFSTFEPVTMFISNPFATVDVSELGGELCEIFGKYNLEELEMEILNFQEDISLKSSFATCSNFWTLVDRNKYPTIHSIALKMYSCFGSMSLCEVAFSSTSIIKNKYRSCLTDSHLNDALRAACSSYTSDFRQLAANMQCQTELLIM
ncbi:hypothetical protein B7P43_G17321 [Cryptotermes secundus]|uniref:HAT C-terminal dimerisation domain-containing protein n=1 Tax=Cryptotermes secundus TaxID=105785 RepID=A0A2J7QY90_9NEOP|nr:hypothetical protein B7P43_G17321 [Cryptotermes secundus]